MSQLPKNKSILIDSFEHQKVKQLADRFNITVKQYVEDMIDYGFKTGFNPTVMKRDRVMEKLNQIQEQLSLPEKNDNTNTQYLLIEIDRKINSMLKNSDDLLKSMNGTINERLKTAQLEKEKYKNLSYDILIELQTFKKSILEKHPKFMEGVTGLIPNPIVPSITQAIEAFEKQSNVYNQLHKEK